MFDLGMQELIVIFVVALLVFGPKKLPELARSMGKGIAHLKKAMTDIKSEVDKEIRDANEQIKQEVPAWKDVVDVDKIKEDLTTTVSESGSAPAPEEEVHEKAKEETAAEGGKKEDDESEGDEVSEDDSDVKRGADS